MTLTTPLSSASVTMRMAHGSCSPGIRETTFSPHPLSPEYRVCMLGEEEGQMWWEWRDPTFPAPLLLTQLP